MNTENPRIYGDSPHTVVLVHGGPGAPGEMEPVARELSKNFGVLEPLQTKNSIAGQVEELKIQIIENAEIPVTLIGWSWGAWLSFIVSAKNPDLVSKLVLIGSGPFEAKYAESIMPIRLSRLNMEEGERVGELITMLQKGNASDNDLEEFGRLMKKADSFDQDLDDGQGIKLQVDIYKKVWRDAEKLRKSGELLKYSKLIKCPVVIVHGDYDSHPYEGVRKPLSKVLKNVKFILLKNCGHHPWLESQAREKFFKILKENID